MQRSHATFIGKTEVERKKTVNEREKYALLKAKWKEKKTLN